MTHDPRSLAADAALRVADRAYVLETGSVVLEGAASDVAQDPRVVSTNLGVGQADG